MSLKKLNFILAITVHLLNGGYIPEQNAMSTCLEISQNVASEIKRPSLVVDYNAGDFTPTAIFRNIIFKAHRHLDNIHDYDKGISEERFTLAVGDYSVVAPKNLKYVTRIDLEDSGGNILPTGGIEHRTLAFLREKYGEIFSLIEAGEPAEWAWASMPTNAGNAPYSLQFQKKIASAGTDDGQIMYPNGAVQYEDEIFVADYGNSRVNVYSLNGELDRSFGASGTGDGEFTFMSSITVGAGMIFVADRPGSSGRIQAFTLDGEYLDDYTLSDAAFSSLYFDDNQIYTAKILGSAYSVAVFNTALTPLRSWGTAGTGDGQFDDVGALMVYGGEVYTCHADTSTRRIQVWTKTGTFVRTWNFAIANTANPMGICEIGGEIAVSGDIVATGANRAFLRFFTTTGTYIRDIDLASQDDALYCYVTQSDGVVLVTAYGGDGETDDDTSVCGVYRYSFGETLAKRIVFMPPADAAYTLVVYHAAYAPKMVNNSDVTWWSDKHPDILELAIKRQLAIDLNRNKTEENDLDGTLERELLALDVDVGLETQQGPPVSRRFGWHP